jgi:hypothetical protein
VSGAGRFRPDAGEGDGEADEAGRGKGDTTGSGDSVELAATGPETDVTGPGAGAGEVQETASHPSSTAVTQPLVGSFMGSLESRLRQ